MKIPKDRIKMCYEVSHRKEIELSKYIERREHEKAMATMDRIFFYSLFGAIFVGFLLGIFNK